MLRHFEATSDRVSSSDDEEPLWSSMRPGYHDTQGLGKAPPHRSMQGSQHQRRTTIIDSELKRAAYHEAGHLVVMRHHGVMIRTAIARTNGDGRASHYEPPQDDLGTHLDLYMSGPAAECLIGEELAPPNPAELIDLQSLPPIRCPDHLEAMCIFRERRPDEGFGGMSKALWESHRRCHDILALQGIALQHVAEALHTRPNKCVPGHLIDRVLDEHWMHGPALGNEEPLA